MKKAPKIEIRQRKGARGCMVGANTEIFLDGKKIPNCTKITVDIEAKGVAKVNMELIGEVFFTGRIGKYSKTAFANTEILSKTKGRIK